MHQRQGPASPRPGYYPATVPISARPRSVILREETHTRRTSRGACQHVPLLVFASLCLLFAVPRALVGWLARCAGTVM